MERIAPPHAADKPDYICRDPAIARAILGLIETVDVQRAQIALLEERLASAEHGLCLVEAELERQATRQ